MHGSQLLKRYIIRKEESEMLFQSLVEKYGSVDELPSDVVEKMDEIFLQLSKDLDEIRNLGIINHDE